MDDGLGGMRAGARAPRGIAVSPKGISTARPSATGSLRFCRRAAAFGPEMGRRRHAQGGRRR